MKKKIMKLVIASEIGEYIAELIEYHSLSSHMKSIAADIREIVKQAGAQGYVLITGQERVSVPCACGCGKTVFQPKVGRKRKYYSNVCRTRGARKRYALRKEEKAKAKALDRRRRRSSDEGSQ